MNTTMRRMTAAAVLCLLLSWPAAGDAGYGAEPQARVVLNWPTALRAVVNQRLSSGRIWGNCSSRRGLRWRSGPGR